MLQTVEIPLHWNNNNKNKYFYPNKFKDAASTKSLSIQSSDSKFSLLLLKHLATRRFSESLEKPSLVAQAEDRLANVYQTHCIWSVFNKRIFRKNNFK